MMVNDMNWRFSDRDLSVLLWDGVDILCCFWILFVAVVTSVGLKGSRGAMGKNKMQHQQQQLTHM